MGTCTGNVEQKFGKMRGVVPLLLFLYESEWLFKVILNDIESAGSAILRPQDKEKKKKEGGQDQVLMVGWTRSPVLCFAPGSMTKMFYCW